MVCNLKRKILQQKGRHCSWLSQIPSKMSFSMSTLGSRKPRDPANGLKQMIWAWLLETFLKGRLGLHFQPFSLKLVKLQPYSYILRRGAEKENELGAFGHQRTGIVELLVSLGSGGSAQKICIFGRRQSAFLFADESKAILINTAIFLSSSIFPLSPYFHIIFSNIFYQVLILCLSASCYFSFQHSRTDQNYLDDSQTYQK